ncbi:glycosyl transferase GTB-type super family [Candidatus Termititenax persephonae]|uniref:Glycosyl transferase GTB-type super family n=1 Tax=Candidatus Termititenax persephonae TaxID=2218525 RepID=A0A388TFG9_9BACT|nr:glycosyl transferase GTB-type super family [Candidatus Termititenax persephonae]
MPRIMFFAHDPGGANAIAPLVTEFSGSLVFAKGPALPVLWGSKELPENALEKYKPDFLLTGTSANDFTERYLWKRAAELGIKSMAVLDFWVNYGIRFSQYGTKDLSKFAKSCDFLPTWICVPDELAKKEMVADGVPENIILPLGNPHFEHIARQAERLGDVKQILTKKPTLITFFSQAFTEDLGQGCEKQVFEDLLVLAQKRSEVAIVLQKHPKETLAKWEKYSDTNIIVDAKFSTLELLKSSDIVVGINSVVLVEAMLLGKRKILSYQLGEKDKTKFVLTRNNSLPFINNFVDFQVNLNKCLAGQQTGIYDNPPKTSGVIKAIKEFILKSCLN